MSFCNRCGKVVPPNVKLINGNCPDYMCIKAPRVVVKPKLEITESVKVMREPVKVIKFIEKKKVEYKKYIKAKFVKNRDVAKEMTSRFVRPWK